jgi:hypothetical protein
MRVVLYNLLNITCVNVYVLVLFIKRRRGALDTTAGRGRGIGKKKKKWRQRWGDATIRSRRK